MNIYIILSKTNTKIGKLIRFFSGFEYNHVSLCLDDHYETLYSFGRYFYHLPLVGGLIPEDLSSLFSENSSLDVRIIQIPTSAKKYEAIANTLQQMQQDTDRYLYDLSSIIFCPSHIHVPVYKAFNCSQFVAKMLEDHGIVPLEMPYYHYTPKDINSLLAAYPSWDETFVKKNQPLGNPDFFTEFSPLFATKVTAQFIWTVFQRIFFSPSTSSNISFSIEQQILSTKNLAES